MFYPNDRCPRNSAKWDLQVESMYMRPMDSPIDLSPEALLCLRGKKTMMKLLRNKVRLFNREPLVIAMEDD